MDAAFKLKTQNERAKVEDLFEFEGKQFKSQNANQQKSNFDLFK